MQKFLSWVICMALGAVVCVLADEPVVKLPERDFELPKLKIVGGGGQYALTSNVALECSVTPPMETDVDVMVCHVKENGELVLLMSCGIRTNARGNASISLGPPLGQWRAGRTLIVSELRSWRQSRANVELQFVGQNIAQDVIVEPIIEAKSVCDVSTNTELKTTVQARQRFLVRGRLQFGDAKEAFLGPTVVIELYEPKVNADGKPSRLISQTGGTISIRTKDGDYRFEAEVKAPAAARNYLLKVRPLRGTVIDARMSPDSVERILSVQAAPNP